MLRPKVLSVFFTCLHTLSELDYPFKNEFSCLSLLFLFIFSNKMKIICAGLSKTGTKSLAMALRELGYGNVHDFEVTIVTKI